MSKPTLPYHTPRRPEPSAARSAIIFVPAVPFVAMYASVILFSDRLPWNWSSVIFFTQMGLLLVAEVTIAALLMRWWPRLYDEAKGGALALLLLGAGFGSCVLGVNLGFIRI